MVIMKYFKNITCLALLVLTLLFQHCIAQKKPVSGKKDPESARENSGEFYYSEADFASVRKFNSHVHINIFDSTFIKQAASDNFRLLTVNVASSSSLAIINQQEVALRLVKAFPEKISYATTFSVIDFNAPDWQEKTLAYLKASFDKGAIAVKVWKTIGMELKDSRGQFVMIDNPAFDTIINFIEKNNVTFIGHLGEPKNAWLPVEQMTVSGDKNYFATHPQYHMYLHPEYPSYEDQINARDRMLEKHPNLRFVGAHLGRLEWNVDELAKRLDKFPNMSVDMAERISHFQHQAVTEWKKVYDFFIRYQDRLIYATDEGVRSGTVPGEVSKSAHENWLRHWKFFTSGERMKVPKVDREFNGLRLPGQVVDKIYLKNAEKWFPGIVKKNIQ